MNADGRVRRKVGRWKQEEVDDLISLTRVYGRGKWKAILEHSGNAFQHRNQARCPAKLGPTWEHGSRLRLNHCCVWGLLVPPRLAGGAHADPIAGFMSSLTQLKVSSPVPDPMLQHDLPSSRHPLPTLPPCIAPAAPYPLIPAPHQPRIARRSRGSTLSRPARVQVDLKDKWRNLVRQKIVNPEEFPSPEGRSRPRMSSGLEEAPLRPGDEAALQQDPQGRHHLRMALPAPPGAHLVRPPAGLPARKAACRAGGLPCAAAAGAACGVGQPPAAQSRACLRPSPPLVEDCPLAGCQLPDSLEPATTHGRCACRRCRTAR